MNNPVLELVISLTATYFGVDPTEVRGSSRKQEYVIPRHVAIAIIYKKVLPSKKAIGRMLGMDHSSIIHATRSAQQLPMIDRCMAMIEPYVERALHREQKKELEQMYDRYQKEK